ncbi:MAG: phosphotransacetylase family protein [Anaerolineae bacterium]|nr:phosphotransacetylase family protein [Anaerolineae bacterium]
MGYLKPVGTQPYMQQGQLMDEDANFVRQVLRLETPASELSPIVITDALLHEIMAGKTLDDLHQKLDDALAKAQEGKDVVLLEGGTSMRDGYSVGLNPVDLVRRIHVKTLSVTRWRSTRNVLDDTLAARARIGDDLQGVVINAVPEDAMDLARSQLVPFLERRGIPVYGLLPYQQALTAVTIGEIVEQLDATYLTGENLSSRLVENLTVGAMTVESALPRFRRQVNKAVVTGGDRADIQAAALETSTTVLVLTGNLHPSPAIIKMAEENGVAVLLVRHNTIETVEAIESIFGRTRLGQAEKLNRFQAMIAENFDYARLASDLGL